MTSKATPDWRVVVRTNCFKVQTREAIPQHICTIDTGLIAQEKVAALIAAAPAMRDTLTSTLVFLESHRSEFVRPEAPDNGYDQQIAAIRGALAVVEAV
jgi:hypothetical protein